MWKTEFKFVVVTWSEKCEFQFYQEIRNKMNLNHASSVARFLF